MSKSKRIKEKILEALEEPICEEDIITMNFVVD